MVQNWLYWLHRLFHYILDSPRWDNVLEWFRAVLMGAAAALILTISVWVVWKALRFLTTVARAINKCHFIQKAAGWIWSGGRKKATSISTFLRKDWRRTQIRFLNRKYRFEEWKGRFKAKKLPRVKRRLWVYRKRSMRWAGSKVKNSPLAQHPYAVAQAVLAIIAFIALVVWAEASIVPTIKVAFSTPLPAYFWWGLAIFAVIAAIIAIFWKNPDWRPSSTTVATTMRSFPWGKLITAAVVIFLLLWAGKQVQRLKEGGIVVTSAWSPVIRIPPGKQVIWDPRENVAHEIRTESGTDYPFPRRVTSRVTKPCERLTWINEASATIQIRVTDPDVKETIFDLTFMPYQEGGPCGGETRATPLPSRTLPFLPLVPPILKDDAKM